MANAKSTDTNVNPLKEYRMNRPKRGYFLIINQVNFEPHLRLLVRTGSDVDARSLENTFTKLGFKVVSLRNLKKWELQSVLKEYSGMNHTDMDCFGMAMMSHGMESTIYCTDDTISIDEVTGPFRADNCASLIGKPKLFFFQACRGKEIDYGVKNPEEPDSTVYSDRIFQNPKTILLPIEADNFFFYSTPLGYKCWRDPVKGSWFIQELCRVLYQLGDKHEFTHLMVRVQGEVASERYITPDDEKQMPASVNQLRKLLYFRPKEERKIKAHFWGAYAKH